MAEIVNFRYGTPAPPLPLPIATPSRTADGHGRRPDVLAVLLAEAAKGDLRAFERLYELTGSRLLAIASGIVGRRDAAEDVLQEAFLRIWRSAHQYDADKGSAYAWCVTIVRNRALSMRQAARRHETGRGSLDPETVRFDGPDAVSLMIRSEEARQVSACLEQLPINHRRSVALVYFEGLTHKEVAQRLGVPFGTAKSWVRRGLARMSRCVLGHESTDWRELVAAEYALGSLQGAARGGFERRRQRDARYCGAADAWETRLAMLTEFLPDAGEAPRHVWKRIERAAKPRRIVTWRTAFWLAASAALASLVALRVVVALN
jgi:RNA polymerase sigma-70 factor (ECF subfamily)